MIDTFIDIKIIAIDKHQNILVYNLVNYVHLGESSTFPQQNCILEQSQSNKERGRGRSYDRRTSTTLVRNRAQPDRRSTTYRQKNN